MDTVHINLGNDSYDVMIDSGIIGRLGKETAPLSGHGRAVIITEEGIDELYGQDLKRQLEKENLNVQQIVLSSSEKSRSLSVVSRVCEALADFGFCAGDLLIGLGGRVVGDVTGFVAATYRRGTPYVQVPTSLLAQIGSAIGGKISIDINGRKNLIGTFYQPKAVYVDPAMVRTLPARFFHNGLGEVIKIGCVADKDLFEIFEKPPLTRISFVFFRKSSAAALPSRHTMWKSIPKTKVSAVSLISAIHWAVRQRDTTVSMISA